MRFEDVREQLEGIPYISPYSARRLYDFIVEHRPQQALELGFAHGVSSCYIAAAFDEIGAGHLTTVDLLDVPFDPTIEELLDKTNLTRFVTVARERSSYNWFLKKKIQERTIEGACDPIYDFCFIDGSKNWTVDGSAFFLVDKLLRTGGWILFDDLNWTYAGALPPGTKEADGIDLTSLSDEELREPHVLRIFELLVMQHPNYSEFRMENQEWGWAHKIASDRKSVIRSERMHLTDRLAVMTRRVARRVRR